MLFPDVSPSRDEVFASLADSLAGKNTRLYVDASVLIHSYEISLAARAELFDLLEEFGERVRIPIWAARETWEFMRGRISRRPLAAPADKLKNEMARFRTEVLRYVDDATLGDLSKDEYQRQLDEALATVRGLATKVMSHEPSSDATTARLMPFIEKCLLRSDLTGILDIVARTAEVRTSHTVPPGFSDSPQREEEGPTEERQPRRRGKNKNPNGDLIIWLEALHDCRAAGAEQLVILTRDTNKEDWAYKPAKIRDEQNRPQDNAGLVTLPLPLLVHEAMTFCQKLRGLHIVSLEMLAHVAQRTMRIQLPNLAAALQSEERTSRRPATVEKQSQADSGPEPEKPPVAFRPSDMAYRYPRGDAFDGLLRALAVEGWGAQNQAVIEMEPLLPDASRDQLVQAGRRLVGAANDGAIEPIDLLERVLGEAAYSAWMRSNLLLGVLAEIYIASDGEAKKPAAARGVIELIYAHENDPGVADAYASVVERRLSSLRRSYLGLPRDHVAPIPIEVILEGKRLRALQAFGIGLLEEDAPSSRALRRSGHEATMSLSELMTEVAREFAVPGSILQPDLTLTTTVQVPENIGYVPWGPGTGVNLR
jgi:hypothetical protein